MCSIIAKCIVCVCSALSYILSFFLYYMLAQLSVTIFGGVEKEDFIVRLFFNNRRTGPRQSYHQSTAKGQEYNTKVQALEIV